MTRPSGGLVGLVAGGADEGVGVAVGGAVGGQGGLLYNGLRQALCNRN